LTDATLPYVIALAERASRPCGKTSARGVNGHICYRPVAEDLSLLERYQEFAKLVG
jgi:hypothetical protein